jgi:hypothetical protein
VERDKLPKVVQDTDVLVWFDGEKFYDERGNPVLLTTLETLGSIRLEGRKLVFLFRRPLQFPESLSKYSPDVRQAAGFFERDKAETEF